MQITSHEYSLLNAAPESIKEATPLLEIMRALDPELQRLGQAYLIPALYARWEELTGTELDLLATGWNLFAYDPSWPVETKRAALTKAIFEKCKLGTPYAVKQAIARLSPKTKLIDWFEDSPQAEPYTFKLVTDFEELDYPLDPVAIKNLKDFVDYAKAARCLWAWYMRAQGGANIYIGGAGAIRTAVYTRLKLNFSNLGVNIRGGLYLGVKSRVFTSKRLKLGLKPQS